MNIVRTDDFEKMRAKLPTSIRRMYTTQENRFRKNIRDPRLHTKKLQGLDGVFSLRITRAYRALFYQHDKNTVIFFAIGHRKSIYE